MCYAGNFKFSIGVGSANALVFSLSGVEHILKCVSGRNRALAPKFNATLT